MAQTPIWALPYPLLTDPADGPDGFSDLALQLETVLSQINAVGIPKPTGIQAGETAVYDGAAYVRSTQTRLGPASIGSGARDGTKFLRDDGSWQAVATTPAPGSITSAMIQDGTIVGADIAASAITSALIADGTIVAADIAAGVITSALIADGTIVAADVASGVFAGAANIGFAFPTAGLYSGYRFTLLAGDPGGAYQGWDCVYRPDIDSAYPWVVVGGNPLAVYSSGSVHATSNLNPISSLGPTIAVPRTGVYQISAQFQVYSNGGNGVTRLVYGGSQTAWVGGFNTQSVRVALGATSVVAGQVSDTYNNVNLSDASAYCDLKVTPYRLI